MEKFDPRLLEAYLQGKCSPSEELQVKQWLHTPEGEQYLLQKIDNDIEALDKTPEVLHNYPLDSHLLYQKINAAKEPSEPPIEKSIHLPVSAYRRSIFREKWLQIAAVLSGLLLVAFAYWLVWENNTKIIHQTAFGETQTIALPDGSTVVLNGNTTLTYSQDWNEKQREVWLTGEAFFSVIHTASHDRFLVHTSEKLDVEVLGTTFNVRNRQGKTKVTLNSGKIQLNLPETLTSTPVMMRPGEMFEFNEASSQYSKKQVNPEVYSSWKSQRMAFENTSLAEIIVLLEQTYGLTVEISDPALLDLKFNGTIPSENVDILLEGLSQLFDLNITRQNNHVIFQHK